MKTRNIFISYSHKDEDLFVKIISHFWFAHDDKNFNVLAWKDDNISVRLEDNITKHIESSEIAILIITADFLASKYIQDLELKLLLERNNEGKIRLIPIIGKPCAWFKIQWLRNLQVLPIHGQTLVEIGELEQDKLLESLAVELYDILNKPSGHINESEEAQKIEKSIPKDKKLVFISHCGQDGDFAELLKLQLENNGYNAWIDIERLKAGEDWRQEIDDAIKKSIAVIVVMTKEARESEYVTYEWSFGWGAETKIIPILLKQTQLHPRLESLQYFDFTNRRARPWDKLITRLSEL